MATFRILNCDPSRDREDDFRSTDVPATAASGAGVSLSGEPKGKNWSTEEPQLLCKVQDQRESGSCVGHATALLLTWAFRRANRIGLQDHEAVSRRYLWMASKETDEFVSRPTTFIEEAGTSIKQALKVAMRWGCVQESDLPMWGGKLWQGKEAAFYLKASRLAIGGFYAVSHQDWRSWLANNGPIVARLDVDEAWRTASGKAVLDNYVRGAPAGHAVCVIGYTEEGHFIVRNSWGDAWGDGGDVRVSEKYAQAAFTEAYGIIA